MRRAMGMLVVAGLGLAACGSESESGSSDSTAASTVATTVAAATTTDAPATTPAPETTDGDPSTTPETTAAPATTAPETTEAPTTTAEPAPTTTAEPVLNGLDPACTEIDARERPADPVAIPETFGPLAVEPALAIELPAARSESEPRVDAPAAAGIPLEVGLLVGVRAPYGEFDESQLSLVGWDGKTIWVRCSNDNFRGFLAAPDAERALVAFAAPDTFVASWLEVVVETGELTPTALPIEDDASLYAWNQRVAVFGPSTAEPVDPARQSLVIVDLADLSSEEVPFPGGFLAESLDSGMFELTADDELVLLSRDGGIPVAIAVWRGDAWSTEPADLADARGVQPAFAFGDSGPSIVGVDPTGATVWESGMVPISAEGFVFGRTGDVVVVVGCWEPLAEGEEFCNQREVGGLDANSGDLLWRLEGDRGVGLLADGYAMVSGGDDSGRSLMIDANTGEAVPGQEWDDQGLFFTGCCDDQFNSASVFGGAIVTVHDRELKVFLPE